MGAEQPWYASRGVIWSGALLAVILLVGAGIALTGGSERRGAGAATVRAAAVDTGGSVCGLPAGSQDPVVGPPNAKWTLVKQTAAPSIPNVGPGVLDGHDRRCFAHSPVGAATAAANMLALDGVDLTTAQALGHVVPGHVRDVYARQPSPARDPDVRLQIAGVRTQVNGGDDVVVTLAVRNQNGALAAAEFPMRWMAPGDWRVQLATIQEPFSVTQIYSLDGFVKWGVA
jgi:hypothetical protein